MKNTMSFEDFKNAMVEEVSAMADRPVEIKHISKATEDYDGISYAKVGDSGISAVVNLNSLYEDYKDGETLESLAEHAFNLMDRKPSVLPFNTADITSFDKMKGLIVPVLVNVDARKDYYSDKITRPVADLAIAYLVRMNLGGDGLGSITIDNNLFDTWNITIDELNDAAFENLDNEEVNKLDMGVFTVVTNKYKTRGAAMCLNSEVMEEYKDCYILPSSAHEILFIDKDGVDDVDALREMVKAVNAECVDGKDFLSNNVYEYRDGDLEVAY